MQFSDLLDLPFDANTGIIDAKAIAGTLPTTPTEVALQFYADHGRKDDFQHAYGKLKISQIDWSLVEKRADVLNTASMNEDFHRWFTNVGARAANFPVAGWKCVDTRRNVREHWEKHRTWLVSPIFLEASLVGSTSHLHLAEGHTRLGLLAGLVEQGVLPASSTHRIWLGGTNAV
jgi:hypothetical protein